MENKERILWEIEGLGLRFLTLVYLIVFNLMHIVCAIIWLIPAMCNWSCYDGLTDFLEDHLEDYSRDILDWKNSDHFWFRFFSLIWYIVSKSIRTIYLIIVFVPAIFSWKFFENTGVLLAKYFYKDDK